MQTTDGQPLDGGLHPLLGKTMRSLGWTPDGLTPAAQSALMWVLWHHQGASSQVGFAMRKVLGLGPFDRLTDQQLAMAKEWDAVKEPPPQPGPTPIPGRATIAASLRWLLRHYDQNTCQHEETTRGGAIWTICRSCGRKWADDEGGFKPYEEPSEIMVARHLLQQLERPRLDGDQIIMPPGSKREAALALLGWIVWDGRGQLHIGRDIVWPGCPVAVGTRVRIRYRDGDEIETDKPEWMRWPWTRPYVAAADIVAFKVLDATMEPV